MDVLPVDRGLAAMNVQLAASSSGSGAGFENPSCPPPDTDTEPFPDYDEDECASAALEIAADKANADHWNHAFGKALQAHIRQQQVDPYIIACAANEPSVRGAVVVERLKDLLANHQLRPQSRQQFISLINVTLRLNQILFHQNSEFLAPKETSDAKPLSKAITSHLRMMDSQLKEQCQSVKYIATVLSQIKRQAMWEYERVRQMGSIVARNLKKPRELEHQMLTIYQALFEEWVHVLFFLPRDPSVLDEEPLSPARAELALYITTILDTLKRCVKNHCIYTSRTMKIRDQYFAHSMNHSDNAAALWEQCWNHDMGSDADFSVVYLALR